MKNQNRPLYLAGLSILICGLFTVNSHAQQAETAAAAGEPLKIYGEGKGQVAYNIMNYPAKASFSPALILLESPKNPEPQVILDVSTTLGLEKTILSEGNHVKLVMESAISKDDAKLKKACATFKNWEIGLQASNFGDPALDAVGNKAIQLSYKQLIHPSFSWALSVEEAAKFELYPEEDEKARKQLAEQPLHDIPALAASLRYNYPDSRGHLHIGGLGRALQYHNSNNKKSYFAPAWGVNVGSEFQLLPEQTSLKGQAVYGQGIGGYLTDLASLEEEVNTAYLKAGSTDLHTIDAWGVYLAIEHRWVPQLRSTLVGRMFDTVNNAARAQIKECKKHYKRGVYASCGLAYHPTEQFHVGGEYLYGYKTTLGDNSAHANRFQVVAGFKF